ncbi:MAG: ATP-binding protein, partial [Desulfobacula sp.]|nr:ATP-binding protein [Desulfobacula sp.]
MAIASGKGGTGKTTVAVNLFHFFSKNYSLKTQLVDCDVEEPNDLLFIQNSELHAEDIATQLIPVIDNNKCTYCRKCVSYCEFNAIVVIPPVNFAEVNPSLCHSCGACIVACEDGAISERPEEIGTIRNYNVGQKGILTEGRLKIGSAMQTMLIKKAKLHSREDVDVLILDAPPGTSCPVVETVADADYVILVTEPTPFGLYDLKLTIEMLREIRKPFGVVINKAGTGDQKVHDYLSDKQIEILGELPYSREYASKYATGDILIKPSIETEILYKAIIRKLMVHFTRNEGDYNFK